MSKKYNAKKCMLPGMLALIFNPLIGFDYKKFGKKGDDEFYKPKQTDLQKLIEDKVTNGVGYLPQPRDLFGGEIDFSIHGDYDAHSVKFVEKPSESYKCVAGDNTFKNKKDYKMDFGMFLNGPKGYTMSDLDKAYIENQAYKKEMIRLARRQIKLNPENPHNVSLAAKLYVNERELEPYIGGKVGIDYRKPEWKAGVGVKMNLGGQYHFNSKNKQGEGEFDIK